MSSSSRAFALAYRAAVALIALMLLTKPVAALTLYAVGGNSQPSGGQTGLYTVDAGTGSMTWVGSPHTAASFDNSIYNGGLAYDPYNDRMYALGCDSSAASALFLINRSDASMVRIGYCYPGNPYAFCSGGLAFDLQTRRLFAVGDLNQPPYQRTSLVELDTATGAATPIGDSGPAGTYLSGLGCDPHTGILYANGFRNFDQNSGLFVLDKSSGAATFIGGHGLTLGRQMNYSGLAVDPISGTMFSFGSFSASQNNLYTVSKSSGAALSVGPESPNGVGVDGALAYVGTDILDAGPAAPSSMRLRAWPNPARAGVSFSFGLAGPGTVSLSLFDLAGRRVSTVTDERLAAGSHLLSWNGADARGERVAAGLYFATLRVDGVVLGTASVMVAR